MAECQTGAASSTSGGTVTVGLGGSLRDTGDLSSDTPWPGPLVPEADGVSRMCVCVCVCVCVCLPLVLEAESLTSVCVCVCVSHGSQKLRESHGRVCVCVCVCVSLTGPRG